MKNYLQDKYQLFKAHCRANWSVVKKSPINLWMTFLIQLSYYFAQILFWYGVVSMSHNDIFVEQNFLYGFIITLAVVDNLYLFLVGQGSIFAQNLIVQQNLEFYLFKPRHAIFMLVFSHVNFTHIIGVVISIVALMWYYMSFSIDIVTVIFHLLSILIGVFVLNGISFLYRLTSFWTSAIVSVRNSNPSFKVMVRPLEAFQGKIRFFLLTFFPALFITGVPAEILVGRLGPVWFFYAALVLVFIWSSVLWVWQSGIKRYQLKVV